MARKSTSKNKAIKGRRNRCHPRQLPAIIRYDSFDMATKAEMERKLLEVLDNGPMRFIMLPQPGYEIVTPIILKRPRFLS